MSGIDRCPICGGDLVHKRVEKLVRGGDDTAVIAAEADVCRRCGERLYGAETIRRFEHVRDQLRRRDTAGLKPLGRSFQAT